MRASLYAGVWRGDRELLDAAALVGHLVPAGSMFAFLAEHRGRVFPNELFADLFPSGKGRPSLPGVGGGIDPDVADVAGPVRGGDRRGGPLRSAVEGRLRD